MWKEFKDFALRGNVLDMAIGVIIGTAFGKIVSSLVRDILMPPLGLALGRMDFSNFFVTLDGQTYSTLAEAEAAAAPTLNFGLFISTLVDFVILAFVIFIFLRTFQQIKKAAPKKNCPYCLSSIPAAATRCAQCTSQL